MSKRPSTFRETDVKRAIRAAKAAGAEVATIEIDARGTIRVYIGKLADLAPAAINLWDEP